MKIVQDSIPVIGTVLGVQNPSSGTAYRPLSFSVLQTVDGITVAYNALTGMIAELTAAEAEVLSAKTVSASESTAALIENRFLVPIDHDDICLADEVSAFAKLFEKNEGIKKYTILPTMDCNARCFYCYELGRPRIAMTPETADDVVSYIQKTAVKDKEIHLAWFGGEPLYNAEAIDRIVDGLIAAGIPFKSSIVSNGYLFDAAMAKKAAEKWKLKKAQITLDGTEENYNAIKAYIYEDGDSPFRVVTDNVERLLQNGVRVNIRLNMGAHNREDLYALVDWLADRYRGYDLLRVYFALLFEEDPQKAVSAERIELAEQLCALERYTAQKGILLISKLSRKIKVNRCMADSAETILILPDGHLGKCEHYTENEFVGTIYKGITDTEAVQSFLERKNTKEMCDGCVLYPRCILLKKCMDMPLTLCDPAARLLGETALRRELIHTYRKLKEQQKEGL